MRKFFPILALGFICQLLMVYGCSKPDPSPPPPVPPTITSISSTNAAPGDTVSVAGTNFSTIASENTVTVYGTAVTVVQSSLTTLAIIFPPGIAIPSGNVTVTVTVNGLTANYTFAYTRPAVVVTTFAGLFRGFGSKDGKGSEANFLRPMAITIDGNGNLFVADNNNHRIRKITPDGTVSTFAGDGTTTVVGNAPAPGSIGYPTGLVFDRSSDNLYVVHSVLTTPTISNIVRKITPTGATSVLASLTATYAGITVDATGNLYVSDDMQLRKITPTGVVTVVAGKNQPPTAADPGNGPINNALIGVALSMGMIFNGPDLLFADWSTSSIRKITGMTTVSNYAGVPFSVGWTDGTAATAKFMFPAALAMNAAGDLFVATGSGGIRKITAAGEVTTIAGSKNGTFGYRDGTGANAMFNNPTGLAIDAAGNLYVCDEGNNCIRKITFNP